MGLETGQRMRPGATEGAAPPGGSVGKAQRMRSAGSPPQDGGRLRPEAMKMKV